ncbi:MAG: RNA polymerase sporulation sigma factor SigK [Clostridiales bacterium]|nr:RNA polymerase sporulation sigma factor SigK [Clostridiales bacterium]
MSISLLLTSLLLANPLVLLSSYVSMGNSFPKPLTEEEEEIYLTAYEENGDLDAKNKLIEHNLRLVAHIVKKYANTGKDPDDLISIGTIGLIKSVNTYKRGKGVRLATYAARCIENELLMHLRTTKKNKVEISLNEPIGVDKEGNEISFNDVLGTDPDSILDDVETKMQIKKLYRILQDELTERERTVIIMRYGLGDAPCKTQREVAKILRISRSYVSRIEKKAVEKLRDAFEKI